jgi:MFS family permease
MYLFRPNRLTPSNTSIHYSFVYILAVLFSYHTLLFAYNTSTFAGQYLQPTAVGVLHGAAALGAVGIFLLFPRLLKRCGVLLLGTLIMVAVLLLLTVLAFSHVPVLLLCALGLLLVLNPLCYLIIDVFSESLIGTEEGHTGSKRGLALALMSAAAVVAPLSMGYLMSEPTNYTPLFVASAVIGVLFLLVLIGAFRRFTNPEFIVISLPTLLSTLRTNKNIRTVSIAHFLLQLFFSWIIIYVPLYLTTVVGFSWQEVSYIISAGLLAYVIFEYPIGIIADRYLGEQEMMALGFVILATTTALLASMSTAGVIVWMVVMFVNRIGASLVEVTTESYFFKQVKSSDAGLMGLFRLLRPAANVAGALMGSLLLAFLSFPLFFIVGALVLAIGVYVPKFLVDTK